MKARITLPCGTVVELDGTPAEIREAMPQTKPAPQLPPVVAPTQLPPRQPGPRDLMPWEVRPIPRPHTWPMWPGTIICEVQQ